MKAGSGCRKQPQKKGEMEEILSLSWEIDATYIVLTSTFTVRQSFIIDPFTHIFIHHHGAAAKPHWEQLGFSVLPKGTSDTWTVGFKPPTLPTSGNWQQQLAVRSTNSHAAATKIATVAPTARVQL